MIYHFIVNQSNVIQKLGGGLLVATYDVEKRLQKILSFSIKSFFYFLFIVKSTLYQNLKGCLVMQKNKLTFQ